MFKENFGKVRVRINLFNSSGGDLNSGLHGSIGTMHHAMRHVDRGSVESPRVAACTGTSLRGCPISVTKFSTENSCTRYSLKYMYLVIVRAGALEYGTAVPTKILETWPFVNSFLGTELVCTCTMYYHRCMWSELLYAFNLRAPTRSHLAWWYRYLKINASKTALNFIS
jgi:hypothetical protein